MRVMVVVKATPQSETGVLPDDPSMFIEMGKFNDELIAAGILLDAAGLKASANGKRLTFRGSKPTVTDGPFAETKELIGGFWIWEVKDMAQVMEWASRAPMEDGDTLEVRPFYEPEDFAGLVPDETVEQEKGWRDDQLAKARDTG
ncbi:YciI family protein [Phenylobacterium sp.]|uniref:YciI family protein n=1 Tax=Phenylobacterium sp. TaxID=1871053 RepID=UPI00286B88CC|nr:YciI family protein [Phenylobacterium sp.]